MRTPLLILQLIATVFISQIQAQRTIVNGINSEISDNLDLRAVASIFGDSRNLQDFERRLNDPQLQISNLDLNNDGQVDYLRVIEVVEQRTHIVIVQSILNRNLYQDVATIEIERRRNNNLRVQIVGNSFFYGPNYIYEPVFCGTPIIYANFWVSNYQPYFSNWNWNNYPSYFWAWNTYPVFRYRHNINICLNNYRNNNFIYINNRNSIYAANNFNNSRSNGYERLYPNNSFSRRNTTITNRYELEKVRDSRIVNSRGSIAYTPNRTENNRENVSLRETNQSDYSQNRIQNTRDTRTPSGTSERNYTLNRNETQRETAAEVKVTPREYYQPRNEPNRENSQQRTSAPLASSQSRQQSTREIVTERPSNQREYSQNRNEMAREVTPRRSESNRESNSSRSSNQTNAGNSNRRM